MFENEFMWKRKRLVDCDRQELYECIETLSDVFKEYYSPQNIKLRSAERVRRFKEECANT